MTEFVTAFSTSPERRLLLRGLIIFRAEMSQLGFVDGCQWINGSFTEDVESIRKVPPSDIDLVTLAIRPAHSSAQLEWELFVQQNAVMFNPIELKRLFNCDAYFVDLSLHPLYTAEQVAYWNGLFSHQKVKHQWKGMVSIPLQSDDAAALAML